MVSYNWDGVEEHHDVGASTLAQWNEWAVWRGLPLMGVNPGAIDYGM